MSRQAFEDVGEPGARIDIVEPVALDLNPGLPQ